MNPNKFSPNDLTNNGKHVNTLYADFKSSEADNTSLYVETHLAQCIRQGQPRKIAEFVMIFDKLKVPSGHPGETELRTVKNTFISAASVSRHIAIDEGLNPQLATAICDAYICNVEKYTDTSVINLYIFQMMMDFASRIRKLKELESNSPLVHAIINDVSVHLYEPISAASVALHLGYSKEHLCRHFKSETGMTIQHYIMEQKVKEAQTMLRHTNYSLSETAENLGFRSQSYFHKVFLKYTGCTPTIWRRIAKT